MVSSDVSQCFACMTDRDKIRRWNVKETCVKHLQWQAIHRQNWDVATTGIFTTHSCIVVDVMPAQFALSVVERLRFDDRGIRIVDDRYTTQKKWRGLVETKVNRWSLI